MMSNYYVYKEVKNKQAVKIFEELPRNVGRECKGIYFVASKMYWRQKLIYSGILNCSVSSIHFCNKMMSVPEYFKATFCSPQVLKLRVHREKKKKILRDDTTVTEYGNRSVDLFP